MSQVSMQLLAASTTTIVVLVVGIIVSLVALAVFAQFFGLWLQAYMSKASVSIGDLIGMKLRKVNIGTIVRAKIQLVKAGIHEVSTNDLESHYLAGGRVINLSQSLISANRAQIELNWKTGAAIDLAGRDVLDEVHTSVNPKVIDVPGEQSGKRTIDAVS
ncbi:MAG: flotillin-like FloA family protein, partial [Planctomycetota bacterium]|nr:flotillin-like FloA family protein [Planctomycetota bacterium]